MQFIVTNKTLKCFKWATYAGAIFAVFLGAFITGKGLRLDGLPWVEVVLLAGAFALFAGIGWSSARATPL